MCYCKPCVYELLLDKLELIGTDATDRAHVVLGQFGRVDLYLTVFVSGARYSGMAGSIRKEATASRP